MEQWYVLQTKPSRERQARFVLERCGFCAALPRAMHWIRTSGNWYQRERLIFPGYVFVFTELRDCDYHLLLRSEDVLRILGTGTGPSPLVSSEAGYMLWLENDGLAIPSSQVYTARGTGGRRPVAVAGFLHPMEHCIRRYDWHRRRAAVSFTIHGALKTIELPITPL